MHLRRCVPACAATALASVLITGSAEAAPPVEPLNQYVVSGRIDPDRLARAGFDLLEARLPGDRKGFGIVATPRQAESLRRDGATVRAPYGTARALAAPASPLTDPVQGYDVFRPWSLKPAPCPTTCATPNVPLSRFYDDLARRNRDVVQKVVYGKSILGQDLVAYKLTQGAGGRHRKRPAVLFNAVQHAREWIAAENNRRLFAYLVAHKGDRASGVPRLLRTRELWIVPIVNPDGYDYTFTSKATRLWRKNLRDVDGDGAIRTGDGVDPNRNWPEKWNYDLEGASDDPTTETYHGTGPASEPEVRGLRALEARIRPVFQIDYHSFAELILYPEGWQVQTAATDEPLLATLAGDDDDPAVEGFDPDVSSELYTTNGDITGDALASFGTQAFTVELSGGTGPDVGGTTDSDTGTSPGGFVFQDREADVEAEFRKNLDFALDLAQSAGDPDDPVSHLGNTAPDFVPTTFAVSYGDPQTVEVNAKRELGAVRAYWQVEGGETRSAPAGEFRGGDRYGEPGVYYHRLRARIRGADVGDRVRVWFASRGSRSRSFTYTVAEDSDNDVLLMAAEDYTGNSPAPVGAPQHLDTFRAALDDSGIGYDVYDVDAAGRIAPSNLGVLSHYRAVLWYTGDDVYTREPTQPGGTGVSKLLDDEVLAVRDYLNEGGRALINGRYALQGAWDQFLFNPLGAPPGPFCPSNQTQGNGDADDPPGQEFNCVGISNDFQQYWLGAYLTIGAAADPDEAAALPLREEEPVGDLAFGLNGPDSAQNQDSVSSFLTTSSVLKPDTYPQFASERAARIDGPPAFDPPDGSQYVFSGAANSSYKRLTKTLSVPAGATSADLSFQVSYDAEPDWDYVLVEAHTAGQDDWTTLPDANGHTSQDLGLSCPQIPMVELHPFLTHYETYTGPPGGDPAATCTPAGTTGEWNAATGNSGGFQDWRVDLGAYAGKDVEVSITYVSDLGVQGLGVFVDEVAFSVDGAEVDASSFEDGLGGWTVAGPPPGSPENPTDWTVTGPVGYVDGPGVRTDRTVFWGFGLEGVTGAATRTQLVRDALRYLDVP